MHLDVAERWSNSTVNISAYVALLFLLKLVRSLNLNAISIHSEEAYPLSLNTYSIDLSNNPNDPFKLVLNVYAALVL